MLSDSIAEVLEKRFETKRTQNSMYSMRAFARDLGISSAQLSMILSKKRGVSAEAADKIAKALKLNRVEHQYFMNLAIQEHGRSKRVQGLASEKLEQIRHVEEGLKISDSQFSLISEWYHLAILQVMQIQNYVHAVQIEGEGIFISKRLNVPVESVMESIQLLVKVGAIQSHGDYHLPVSDFVMVKGAVPTPKVKRFQTQMIRKSLEAIQFQDPSECAFKTTLLSIDADDFQKINLELGEFCKNIMIKYGKTHHSPKKPNQVYALVQQLIKIAEVNHG